MNILSRIFVWVLIVSFGVPGGAIARERMTAPSSSPTPSPTQSAKVHPNYNPEHPNYNPELEAVKTQPTKKTDPKKDEIDLSNDVQVYSHNEALENPEKELKTEKEKQKKSRELTPQEKFEEMKKLFSFMGTECLEIDGKRIEEAGFDSEGVPYVIHPKTKEKLTGSELNSIYTNAMTKYKVKAVDRTMTTEDVIKNYNELFQSGAIKCQDVLAKFQMMVVGFREDLDKTEAYLEEQKQKGTNCTDCKTNPTLVNGNDRSSVKKNLDDKIVDENQPKATADDLFVYLNDKEIECRNVKPPKKAEVGTTFVGRVPGCLADWGLNAIRMEWNNGSPKFIGGGESHCLVEMATGFVKMLWSSVKAIFWDLPKMGIDWVKSWFAEDKTAEKAHAGSQLKDEDVKDIQDDKDGWIMKQLKNFYAYIGDAITTNFGCEEWSGMPHNSECKKPWPGIPCAKCNTLLNTVCGVYGALGSEVVTAILTGGALQGVKAGLTVGGKVISKVASGSKTVMSRATSAFTKAATEASVASKAGVAAAKLPTNQALKVSIGKAINFTAAKASWATEGTLNWGRKMMKGFGFALQKTGDKLDDLGRGINKPFKAAQDKIIDPLYNSKYAAVRIPSKVVIGVPKAIHSHAKDWWKMMEKGFMWDFGSMRHIRTVRLAEKARRAASLTGVAAITKLEHATTTVDDIYKSERLKYEVMLDEATTSGNEVSQAYAKKQIRLLDEGRSPVVALEDASNVPLHKYKLEAESNKLKEALKNAKTNEQRRKAISDIDQFAARVNQAADETRYGVALKGEMDAEAALFEAARSQGLAMKKLPSGAFSFQEPEEILAGLGAFAKERNLQVTTAHYSQLKGMPPKALTEKIFPVTKWSDKDRILLNYKLKPFRGRVITGDTQKAMAEVIEEAKRLNLKVVTKDNVTSIEFTQGGLEEYRKSKNAFLARAEKSGFDVDKKTGMFAHPTGTPKVPEGGTADAVVAQKFSAEELQIVAKDEEALRLAEENAKKQGLVVTRSEDGKSLIIKNMDKNCKP